MFHALTVNEECMMERVLQRSRRGFTLLEIVVALAIFTVTLGVTAQGLAYAYGVVNLQNQRVTANNDCRAVISALRQVAAERPASTACPAGGNMFPCVLLNWVNNFPENAIEVAFLPVAERPPFAGMYTLQNETIAIDLTDNDGVAAVNGASIGAGTNPVRATVTIQWRGPRGILYTEIVTTAVTDR
jgi:prepilin-type N-terminal cleavage/methylation domain-containing protein